MSLNFYHTNPSLVPSGWLDEPSLLQRAWHTLHPLSPFMRVDNSDRAQQQTIVRLAYDTAALYIRFDCYDEYIWGTYTERDQPIYQEEVVEVFLAPGAETPTRYFEFEISPNGILFDAEIHNPQPENEAGQITVNEGWNCEGIRWAAERNDALHMWAAALAIPWASVHPSTPLPNTWRINFCRIERPRHTDPEFSCWSPTHTTPANFHKPAYFGLLSVRKFVI